MSGKITVIVAEVGRDPPTRAGRMEEVYGYCRLDNCDYDYHSDTVVD